MSYNCFSNPRSKYSRTEESIFHELHRSEARKDWTYPTLLPNAYVFASTTFKGLDQGVEINQVLANKIRPNRATLHVYVQNDHTAGQPYSPLSVRCVAVKAIDTQTMPNVTGISSLYEHDSPISQILKTSFPGVVLKDQLYVMDPLVQSTLQFKMTIKPTWITEIYDFTNAHAKNDVYFYLFFTYDPTADSPRFTAINYCSWGDD